MTAERLVIMTDAIYREFLVCVGRAFLQRGLASGASGNLSLRLPGGNVLMTPAGCGLGELVPERLSVLDVRGELVAGDRPTKESAMHLACYAARPDCGAVVHLHSPWATAVSCLADRDPADAVPALTPYGLMRYGRVALSPYRKPGSLESTEDMARLMLSHRAVLLRNHGLVIVGGHLKEAADNAEELEAACRLSLLLHGQAVRLLTPEEQDALLQKRM